MPLDFWSMYLVEFVIFCRFQGPSKHPVVYEPAAGAVFFSKNTPLDCLNIYLVDFVNIWELGGHQGWGNLLSGLGEPAGRTRGNLPGRQHSTAL